MLCEKVQAGRFQTLPVESPPKARLFQNFLQTHKL